MDADAQIRIFPNGSCLAVATKALFVLFHDSEKDPITLLIKHAPILQDLSTADVLLTPNGS
jgi:hypothetical protein